MTGRELITASLKLIGAVAPGESIPAVEAIDGLSSLNRMLGSWSNESLLIYSKVREEFTLTPGDGSYSIGSGADFNTTRPQIIENAALEIQSSSPTVEIPITILRSTTEWSNVIQKELNSNFPQYIFAEGTYPNDTINLYPVPSEANRLVLYSVKPISSISTIDSSVSFPPGYEEALIYNLAIRLAPEYGRQISEMVMMIANESKMAIKRINFRPELLKADKAFLTRKNFNFLSGGNNK